MHYESNLYVIQNVCESYIAQNFVNLKAHRWTVYTSQIILLEKPRPGAKLKVALQSTLCRVAGTDDSVLLFLVLVILHVHTSFLHSV